MKNSLQIKKVCTAIVFCSILFGTLAACSSNKSVETKESESRATTQTIQETQELTDGASDENNRATLSKQLSQIEKQYKQNPDDSAIALQYAQTLFSLGNFEQSQTIVKQLLKEDPSPEMIYLAAQIDYITGNYDKAEELYSSLVESKTDYALAGQAGLQMVYYQTNEYSKAKKLFAEEDLENPLLDMMKAFDEAPYQMDWHGKEQTIIPFTTTDPMPIIPIEINGVRMNAFIDTGAPMISIDESIVSKLGIKAISTAEGHGAGGSADISFGQADSMKLGDVDIQNFPVLSMPFDGFENVFDGYVEDVHAIISTNFLQQFIPILDYPSGQIILVPRSKAGLNHLDKLVEKETVIDELPFVLANTHYMFAQGSINGHTGLNMFVDTGMLGREGAGIELPKETMDLLAIPTPELTPIIEGYGGIGGSDYEEGVFDLSSYGLGNLKLKDSIGLYSTSGHSDDWIDMDGFIGDALIGYQYVKHYKWIINFDTMTMTFCD